MELPKFSIKQLKHIAPQDKNIICAFYNCKQLLSCEYSFPNLINWQKIYGTMYCIYDEFLVVYFSLADSLLMPISKHKQQPTLSHLLRISDEFVKIGKKGNVYQAPESFIRAYPDIYKYFNVSEDYDFADYIHKSRRLIELKGKKLRKKRNLIAQFKSLYPEYKVNIMSSNFFKDCLLLAEDLITHNPSATTKHELCALKRSFDFFDQLSLHGVVITLKDTVVAFSIYSFMCKNELTGAECSGIKNCVAIIHFEKALKNLKGCAQVINHETSKMIAEKALFINREQDLGIPGLRKAKKSYDPDILLKNYLLIRK